MLYLPRDLVTKSKSHSRSKLTKRNNWFSSKKWPSRNNNTNADEFAKHTVRGTAITRLKTTSLVEGSVVG